MQDERKAFGGDSVSSTTRSATPVESARAASPSDRRAFATSDASLGDLRANRLFAP